MYGYSNDHYGCGCGAGEDYREDRNALARLARAAEHAEAEDCTERRSTEHDCAHTAEDCSRRQRPAGNCAGGVRAEQAGQNGCRCSICGLVNCVRRTICGCGCGCRRCRRG